MSWLANLTRGLKQLKNFRLYRRLAVSLPVKVFLQDAEKEFDGVISNWSPGGVFLQIGSPLPLHAQIVLEFSLGETGGSKLKLRGQIVRLQNSTESFSGVGVMFSDFTESGLNVLRDFLLQQPLYKD